MKSIRIFFIAVLAAISAISANAQVSISTTGSTPDPSAMLDVSSTAKGILIPRMTKAMRLGIGSPSIGLLVYQTDDVSGFYYYGGLPGSTAWLLITSGTASGWGLTGNNGTNPAFNFIGTTDNVPLFFRVNGTNSGTIDPLGNNSAFGVKALFANSTGKNNTANGFEALVGNTTGFSNVAVGTRALSKGVNSNNTVAIGDSALLNNRFDAGNTTDGIWNSAVGSKALYNNRTGSRNTAMGYQALYSNTEGLRNTAIGTRALHENSTGAENTATGAGALFTNSTGEGNTANGLEALFNNITGYDNVAVGRASLYSNKWGNENTAVGTGALYNNENGNANTAVGFMALDSCYSAAMNTAVGHSALKMNTYGWNNTGVGFASLAGNSSGQMNTAIGRASLEVNTIGGSNTACGIFTLQNNIDGNENTAVGNSALFHNVAGNYNTACGSGALNISANSYMTGLGHNADVSVNTIYNSSVIGDAAIVNASGKVRIGDATMTVIEGQVAWSYPSDGRFKVNVSDDVKGLEFIKRLRPVVYNFDTRKYTEFLVRNLPSEVQGKYLGKDFGPSTAIRQSGFVAQEVAEAARATGYDFNGVHSPVDENDNYSVAYSQFVVPLVKAVQEQQKIIMDQQVMIGEQKARYEDQQKQIDELKAIVAKIRRN